MGDERLRAALNDKGAIAVAVDVFGDDLAAGGGRAFDEGVAHRGGIIRLLEVVGRGKASDPAADDGDLDAGRWGGWRG